jgi:hypothetical protein
MVKKELLENLSRLGFTMMEIQEDVDANETLAEVVKSHDIRLWEGFPALLANTAQEYGFDYELTSRHLAKRPEDQKNFHALLLLSVALYQHFHLSFQWTNQFKKGLSEQDLTAVQGFKSSLSHDEIIILGDKRLHADRLKTALNNYFKINVKKTGRIKEKYEELSLEYALSQVFSPKQKELFKKKLNGEPFTKTEREYYSRVVKRKVSALANPDLHRFAQKLMNY